MGLEPDAMVVRGAKERLSMLRRQDGSFYVREVKRAVPDVVRYVVYLGVGRHLHAATLDWLYKHAKHKHKFKQISKEDFKNLIRRTDGRTHGHWKIEVTEEDIVVVS